LSIHQALLPFPRCTLDNAWEKTSITLKFGFEAIAAMQANRTCIHLPWQHVENMSITQLQLYGPSARKRFS
jgi:hypothetical protein